MIHNQHASEIKKEQVRTRHLLHDKKVSLTQIFTNWQFQQLLNTIFLQDIGLANSYRGIRRE